MLLTLLVFSVCTSRTFKPVGTTYDCLFKLNFSVNESPAHTPCFSVT